jgi:hypothetical protein
MARYRKKPVEVEAVQATPDGADEVADWVTSSGGKVVRYTADVMRQGGTAETHAFQVKTLLSYAWVHFGDYVVRDAAGFSVVTPDLFAAAYEEA